ncbi:MAG: hypothetical protein COB65_02955 [Thalassobium sp.]|nr:MAG: hypothetical protein COB65_02955 [Thalassobium sp.]
MNNNQDISDLGKIEDAGKIVQGGGVDRYWDREDIVLSTEYYVGTNKVHNWAYLHGSEEALNQFNLVSIEFGNWMSQEDRANFLYASMLGLHQLALVFGIENRLIGLGGKLSIALGARGKGGRAIAHYEPNPRSVINITKPKGKGSLAHEFAHAIDNALSYYTGQKFQTYVSGGRSTRKGYSDVVAKEGNYFEKQFEEFFNILFYEEDGSETDFNEAIKRETDYYNQRNEVFARTFEVYTLQRLKKKKIRNNFLVQPSYNNKVYPSTELVKKVSPLIDKIVVKGFELMSKKGKDLNGLPVQVLGYKGFRKILIENANLEDTLTNMQRIAYRDTFQVAGLAEALRGKTVAESAENIWNWLRENTKYKLDKNGLEELRTPARSIIDGKRGLSQEEFGIDCDDYTILISAILLNLGIEHEYRVAAYEEKGQFQHIYPVAFDEQGNEYVIDAVPEIPHFNYEAKPIKDIKIIEMTNSHLNGYLPLDATINPSINPPTYGKKSDDMELHELSGINDAEEFRNDLQEELNQPFNLSGIEEDLEEEILQASFLSGLGEVETEEEADIVISSSEDAMQLVENGLLAELNKAGQSLIKEKENPTELSKLINIGKELRIIDEIMEAWNNEDEREATIKQAIVSRSSYANFYKALLMSLRELEESDLLSGIEDEPIYLAQMEEVDLSDMLDDNDEFDTEDLGFFRKLKKAFKRSGGFFKKVFKKVGSGVKKAVKAVVRFNPITIATRAAILMVLKTNGFNVASRLIYGYLNQSQADAKGLDLTEWRKVVDAKNKGERFFTKMGGKAPNFRKAIVKGRAASKTGIRLSGLGASTQKANGFVNFMKKMLSKINITKLFRKKKRPNAPNQRNTAIPTPRRATPIAPNEAVIDDGGNIDFPATRAEQDPNTPKPSIFKRMVTKDFWKNDVWAKHKTKIMAAGAVITILIPLSIYLYQQYKKKKKNQLRGVKAARTRARNRKARPRSVGTAKRRRSPSRRKSTPKKKAKPVGRGSTTVISTPTKGRGKTRVKKMTSKERMSLMHSIAQKLRKKHPKMKYSRLLSLAAKQM